MCSIISRVQKKLESFPNNETCFHLLFSVLFYESWTFTKVNGTIYNYDYSNLSIVYAIVYYSKILL